MIAGDPVGVAAAVLAGAAVWLAAPVHVGLSDRTTQLAGRQGAVRRPAGVPGSSGSSGATDVAGARRTVGVAVLAGLAPFLFLGGALGAVAGAVVGVVVHRTLIAREPTHVRRRREAIARDLPHVVDLLGVALAAGAAPTAALEVVTDAVRGPVAEELELARRGLALGRDPVVVWRELGRRPALAPLGRTMARAVETGASVGDALHRLAEDLQAVSRLEAESRARTVGVRAAAPLGLCLLPAFVLVGVVPLVAATVGALLDG